MSLQAKPDLGTFSDEISRDTVLRNDNDRNPQRGPSLPSEAELQTQCSNSLKKMVTQIWDLLS